VIALVVKLCFVFQNKIKFFSIGLDSKFRLSEINLLWKLAKECDLEDPLALYVSVPSLNRCISMIITNSRKKGTEKSFKTQDFLARLYKFRTKIALDTEGKKGLQDTRSLDKGQRLRIILKGKGVFLSKILNNGHELVIEVPRQNNMIKIPGDEWVGKNLSVYLWRKGDASYVFDSIVFNAGMFTGESCLYLQHTDKLLRAQKRQSVRCDCKIYAQMYMIKSEVVDYNIVENSLGYRCLLEDISEDGAMIRIGGKGKTDVQIKLQFNLNDTFIMMYGIIRAVEFNESMNQSRLHFECVHIEPSMKNAILSYVYKVIPEDQKEIDEAISQTENDALETGESAEVIAQANKYTSASLEKTADDISDATDAVDPATISIPDVSTNISDKDIGSLTKLEQEKINER
jgi:c-di-GMP-binding flagellar brake protein YcgR